MARIARNPELGIRYTDILAGTIMSRINNLLRICLYTFLRVGR
jgi:hypothetical protein